MGKLNAAKFQAFGNHSIGNAKQGAEKSFQNTRASLKPVKKSPPKTTAEKDGPYRHPYSSFPKRIGEVAPYLKSRTENKDANALFQNTRALLKPRPRKNFRRASVPPKKTYNYTRQQQQQQRETPPAYSLKQRRFSIPKKLPSNGLFDTVKLRPTPRNTNVPSKERYLFALKPIPKFVPNDNQGPPRFSLKPIPKKTDKEEEQTEGVSLKPVPKKEDETVKEEEAEPVPVQPCEEEAEVPKGEEMQEPETSSPPPVEPKQEPVAKKETKAPLPVEKPIAQPQPTPTADHNNGNSVSVATSEVFMAFTIPDCESEPSDKEYQKLVKTTQKFYEATLKKKFKDTFQSITLGIHHASFNQNQPNANYNVYVEWEVQGVFKDAPGAPDHHQLCQSLVKKMDINKYLGKHLETLFKTPFREATGVFTQATTEFS